MRLTVLVSTLVVPLLVPAARAGDSIDYTRQIRPILSNHCYQCHGPDAEQRQAGLRLDDQQAALAALDSGNRAIVPGDVSASSILDRVHSTDPERQMPPPSFTKPLSPQQKELLSQWIKGGAVWKEHWAFQRPVAPELPAIDGETWSELPIDRFVQARLKKEGIAPSPEADRVSLLRRVTYDLTGLPPSPEEVDAFLSDQSPEAYERVVDRLLESPRYGEHMARYWLDAARFGDTHGLHLDNYRSMWPYRDWVIRAFQNNMPFDQFSKEQLAGDLMPGATDEQRIASGFNRCNVTTSEGGSIDEEYYVRYTVDRVETTATVFMGLTLGCAVCHDHKFDPFTQKDFYQLFAYFNNQTEKPMDGNKDDPPPTIRVTTPEQKGRLTEISEELSQLADGMDQAMPEADAEQMKWESEGRQRLDQVWKLFPTTSITSTGGATFRTLEDGSTLVEGPAAAKDDYAIVARLSNEQVTAIRLEALLDDSLPSKGPGRCENGNVVLSEVELEAVSLADPNKVEPVRFASAQADYEQRSGDYFAKKVVDGQINDTNGWAPGSFDRREDRCLILTTLRPVGFEGGTELRLRLKHQSKFSQHALGRFRISYATDPEFASARWSTWSVLGPIKAVDGATAFQTAYFPEDAAHSDQPISVGQRKYKWVQRRDVIDGKPHELRGGPAAAYFYRTIELASPRQVTVGLGSDDAVKVWLDGKVVLEQNVQRSLQTDADRLTFDLTPGIHQLLVKVVNYTGPYQFVFRPIEEGGTDPIQKALLLSTPTEKQSPVQKQELRTYYRTKHVPKYQEMVARRDVLLTEKSRLEASMVPTLVMQERDEVREAYMLIRGEYDKKGEKVPRATPAALPPMPKGVSNDRLGLAEWLVSGDHPLTARVTVNRFWQQFFGLGLVRTSEDFGVQGDFPSHPELLDWLATEFVQSGWDVKSLVKQMVMSKTYQQNSRVTPEAHASDPENRLLARGPRYRLDAEVIRDTALAVSGLLVERVGGPSVKPYQPPGIWEAVAYPTSNTANFQRDTGSALYRRSLYTFWKRTAHPPAMQTFDAPSREQCSVRRARTNTPLQALVLMNDEQFVEAAKHLAARILREGGASDADRLAYGFRLVTARWPDEAERSILERSLAEQYERFQGDEEASRSLLSVGESRPEVSLDPKTWAAWTMIANMLLNLHETVTKG